MNKDLDYLYHALLLAMGQEYERYQALLSSIQEETDILKKCVLDDIFSSNKKKETVASVIEYRTGNTAEHH